MAITRFENDRPRILEADQYAAYLCPALYHAAAEAMADAELFLEELFASTATEASYPHWADALGIKASFAAVQAMRRVGLPYYLQRGGMFSLEYLRALVSPFVDPDLLGIEEGLNTIQITVPSSLSAAAFERMQKTIEAQRPLHLTVTYAGSISI